MAERRMFAKTIVLSDAFLDMPLTARCLYFTLGMLADDDGFINSPKSIIRQCGASEDDLRILIGKNFVIPFESGIVVIKHWRINNYLRNDRYKATIYQDELSELTVDETGNYHSNKVGIPSMGIPSIGKDRLGKDSIGEDSIGKESIRDIVEYLNLSIGSHYKPDTPKTVSLIKARLKEGFTVDDFKLVIDKKVKAWGEDKKMNQYLRPETLFGNKFEGYLNERESCTRAEEVDRWV